MGGWGSGRHHFSKETTDSYRKLDVRYLQKRNMLRQRHYFNLSWSRNGMPNGNINICPEEDCVTLSYRHRRNGGEWKSKQYAVPLEWSDCNYGGSRAWFRCPIFRCGRRVAILYGGDVFACRHCHKLAYPSQQESAGDRADSRAWAIRKRCGDWGCLFDPLFRPKGMHETTFRRLEREYQRAIHSSASAFATSVGLSVDDVFGLYS